MARSQKYRAIDRTDARTKRLQQGRADIESIDRESAVERFVVVVQ